MRARFAALILLAVPPLVAVPAPDGGWPAPPPPAQPSSATLQSLRQGSVLVDEGPREGPGGSARVQAMFWTTAEHLWSVLGNCEANLRFVPGMEECEILEVGPTHARTRQVVDRGLLFPHLEFVFETAREPYSWIAIRLESGDLEEMRGSWRLDPLEEYQALLVTHEIRVRPKMPAPDWLVRRTLKSDTVHMFRCLRYMAGASGPEHRATRDRNQCPHDPGQPIEGAHPQAD